LPLNAARRGPQGPFGEEKENYVTIGRGWNFNRMRSVERPHEGSKDTIHRAKHWGFQEAWREQ